MFAHVINFFNGKWKDSVDYRQRKVITTEIESPRPESKKPENAGFSSLQDAQISFTHVPLK